MAKVRQYMTRDPITVHPDTSLAQCARLLLRHNIHQLPVADDMGRLLGLLDAVTLFTAGHLVGPDRDAWLSYDPNDTNFVARDLMEPAQVVVDAESDLLHAFVTMLETPQPAAVVMSDHRIVGVMTEHDALGFAASMLPLALALDEQYSTPVATIEALARVDDAWKEMHGWGIRHLVIQGAYGQLGGVVSRKDLAMNPTATSVSAASRSEATYTVNPGTSFRNAARTMLDHHIGCLPVLDEEGTLLGIITRRDVLRTLVLYLENEVERLARLPKPPTEPEA